MCLRCKQCSEHFQNPVFTGVETWDEQAVAEGTVLKINNYIMYFDYVMPIFTWYVVLLFIFYNKANKTVIKIILFWQTAPQNVILVLLNTVWVFIFRFSIFILFFN